MPDPTDTRYPWEINADTHARFEKYRQAILEGHSTKSDAYQAWLEVVREVCPDIGYAGTMPYLRTHWHELTPAQVDRLFAMAALLFPTSEGN